MLASMPILQITIIYYLVMSRTVAVDLLFKLKDVCSNRG